MFAIFGIVVYMIYHIDWHDQIYVGGENGLLLKDKIEHEGVRIKRHYEYRYTDTFGTTTLLLPDSAVDEYQQITVRVVTRRDSFAYYIYGNAYGMATAFTNGDPRKDAHVLQSLVPLAEKQK